MKRVSPGVRAVLVLVLLANALDLSTSTLPSPADHLFAIPRRELWEWGLQIALLVPLLVLGVRRTPALVEWLRALPVPRVAGGVLAAYFAIACVHVALRLELFPWSPAAMFSSAVAPSAADSFSHTSYVVVRGSWVEPVSFLREGNAAFQQLGLGFDYKAGWVMRLYAPTHSSARDLLVQLVTARGLPAPRRVKLTYQRSTGRALGFKQLVEAP